MTKKLFVAAASVVLLYSGSAFSAAEVRIDKTACGVLDADGRGQRLDPGNAVIHQVKAENGNSKITCSGKLPAGAALPDKGSANFSPKTHPNIRCGTGFGATQDWHNVVTKSGQVTLTCHVKAK